MPGPIEETLLEASPGTWRFCRADPAPNVAGLVVEYWEVEGSLRAFRETLLPNGCVELMVNLGPPHRVLSDQAPGMWDRSWFSGLQERALVIESLEGTHLLAARLHPLGALELLGPGAPRAANSVVELGALIGGDAAAFRDAALATASAAERFNLLERFLSERRGLGKTRPDFVRQAATRIEAAHGALRVSELHDELGVSRKHLAVTFARTMGVSAKAYAQIQRFTWTLARLQERSAVDWSGLAGEAGYSDQSHLVRDFRRIGAATPTEYLRRATPDGTALLGDSG